MWSIGNRQWAMGNGQWAIGNGQLIQSIRFRNLFHDTFHVSQSSVFSHAFNYYPESFGYIIIVKCKCYFILLMGGNYLWVPV